LKDETLKMHLFIIVICIYNKEIKM